MKATRPGLYLCGCNPAEKVNYHVDKFNGTDNEGFQVCPEHGERLYGWRSPRATQPGQHSRLDWSKVGSKPGTRFQVSNEPDRRDNRDPAVLGAEIFARSNGHVVTE